MKQDEPPDPLGVGRYLGLCTGCLSRAEVESRPITGEPDGRPVTGSPTPRDPSRGGPGVPNGLWRVALARRRRPEPPWKFGDHTTPQGVEEDRRGSSSRFPRRTATLVLQLWANWCQLQSRWTWPWPGCRQTGEVGPVRCRGTRAGSDLGTSTLVCQTLAKSEDSLPATGETGKESGTWQPLPLRAAGDTGSTGTRRENPRAALHLEEGTGSQCTRPQKSTFWRSARQTAG